MENWSENTLPHVLHPIVYLIFQNLKTCKTGGWLKFDVAVFYSTWPRYLLDKVKIAFKLILDRKHSYDEG